MRLDKRMRMMRMGRNEFELCVDAMMRLEGAARRWKLNPCVVDETQYRRIEQQKRQ